VTIAASEGNTVPSTDILGYKAYVDIGSGTVLRLFWPTPVASGNIVDSYTLNITTCDTSDGSLKTLLNTNIGKVNEYYINSELLDSITKATLQLSIKLTANSAKGSVYSGTSSVLTVNIARGCGTYIEVTSTYPQPIMKRAIAFSKLDYKALTDSQGQVLQDSEGKTLYVKMSRAQASESEWTLMQEFNSKNAGNVWKTSDIRYEVLTDSSGELITDVNNHPIYVL
jgi:hypothetical protein